MSYFTALAYALKRAQYRQDCVYVIQTGESTYRVDIVPDGAVDAVCAIVGASGVVWSAE